MIARRGGRKRVLELGTAWRVFYVARLRVTERQRIRNLSVPKRWARPRQVAVATMEEQSAGKPRAPLRPWGLPGRLGVAATDDALLRGVAPVRRAPSSEIARIAGGLTPPGAAGSSSATPWTELRAMTLALASKHPVAPITASGASRASAADVARRYLLEQYPRQGYLASRKASQRPWDPISAPRAILLLPARISGHRATSSHAGAQGPHERAISSVAGAGPARRGRPGAW